MPIDLQGLGLAPEENERSGIGRFSSQLGSFGAQLQGRPDPAIQQQELRINNPSLIKWLYALMFLSYKSNWMIWAELIQDDPASVFISVNSGVGCLWGNQDGY